MSTLKATIIEPATGTDITLGTTGDTISLPGNTLVLDTFKDAGGNTLFSSDGSGAISNVNAGFTSTQALLSSQTVSGASALNFTSGLTATYKEYVFEFMDINPSTDDTTLQFQCSTDGGSNYNVEQTTNIYEVDNPDAAGGGSFGYVTSRELSAATTFQTLAEGVGNVSTEISCGTLHLFNPAGTTFVKNYFVTTTVCRHNGVRSTWTAGYFNTASAINAISFKMAAGTMSGTIKMYGIK